MMYSSKQQELYVIRIGFEDRQGFSCKVDKLFSVGKWKEMNLRNNPLYSPRYVKQLCERSSAADWIA